MAAGAYVQLLGQPGARVDGKVIDFLPNKRFQLLAYLAYQNDWVSRDKLAFLFWADETDHTARHNLRQLLKYVRRLDWLTGLEADEQRVRWHVETDVTLLKHAIDEGKVDATLRLYQGPLLPSLEGDEGEFNEWLVMERAGFHGRWREVLFRRVGELESSEQHELAIQLLRALLERDPLDEEGLQAYLSSALKAGHRDQALSAYRAFAKRLKAELEMEPSSATKQLAKEVEATPPPPPPPQAATVPARPSSVGGTASIETERLEEHIRLEQNENAPTANTPALTIKVSKQNIKLPKGSTAFVGRETELAELSNRLQDPACRLITIVAVGGMGKTRLALEVGERLAPNFADGVCFVPFGGVSAPELMTATLADALDFSFLVPQRPKNQLLTYLQSKTMLLILDNLEHLLDDTSLLTELLQAAPKLQLLVTSREPLNLHAEWVYDLGGMTVPREQDSDTRQVDALRLFVQTARMARKNFELSNENTGAVIRICQQVGGMPLALELSAQWLRVLTPRGVLEELEKGLEVLETSTSDMSLRHHSVRSIFEATWNKLGAKEQDALKKLVVFEGGFSRQAAYEISGTSLPTLLSLVNKSLIYTNEDGRFGWHPLLHSFGKMKLRLDNSLSKTLEQAHSRYYLNLLNSLDYWGKDGTEAMTLISQELTNIERACYVAACDEETEKLEALEDIVTFFDRNGRLEEGIVLLNTTLSVLRENEQMGTAIAGKLLINKSWLHYRRGDLEIARTEAEAALKIGIDHQNGSIRMKAENIIGWTYYHERLYEVAKDSFSNALNHAKQQKDSQREAMYLSNLSAALIELKMYDEARTTCFASIQLHRRLGSEFGAVPVLINLSKLYYDQNQHNEALGTLKEAERLAREIGFQLHLPLIRANIAENYFKLSAFEEARKVAQHTLDMLSENQELSLQVNLITLLGRIALYKEDYKLARELYRRSFFLALSIDEPSSILYCFVIVAQYLFKVDKLEESGMILMYLHQNHTLLQKDELDITSELLKNLGENFYNFIKHAENRVIYRNEVIALVHQVLLPFEVSYP